MNGGITEKKGSEKDSRNYPVIDLAKMVGSLLVFMIHVPFVKDQLSGTPAANLSIMVDYYLARIAVPFFFISSGFLLFRKTSFESCDRDRIKRYLIHITRLYLIWTIIYLPVSISLFLNHRLGFLKTALLYLRDTVFTGSIVHLWYFPALIFGVWLVSYLITKKVKPVLILILSAAFYFLGLFAQSWFGMIVPLRELAPSVWNFLLFVEKIIVTTRDGLFEGFLFVAMGMYIAFTGLRIPMRKSLPLFVLCFLAMGVERYILLRLDYIREYDMYLFLAPAAFFLFCFLLEVKLPDHPCYRTLRSLSALLFYSHIWISFLTKKALVVICPPLAGGFPEFLITLILTLAFSWAVIRLSEYRRFHWLKALYI